MFATIACRAGIISGNTQPMTKTATRRCQKASRFITRRVKTVASLSTRMAWPVMISLLRSKRSAITPPNGEMSSKGTATTRFTSPSARALLVSWKAMIERTTNWPFIAKKNAMLLPISQRNWGWSRDFVATRQPLWARTPVSGGAAIDRS